MEDDTQVVIAAGVLDESLGSFHALCLEQVRICRAIDRPELRRRALTAMEAAFVDCLAALWAGRATCRMIPDGAIGQASGGSEEPGRGWRASFCRSPVTALLRSVRDVWGGR
jgi:hypothetical protein